MFVLRSTCFQAPCPCYVYAQIYMPMCSLSCLCLDIHAYVFFAIFMLRSMCLWASCHTYAQIHVFIRSMPYLCLQIYMLVAMPCAFIATLFLDVSLSSVLALIGRVQIQIPRSRPTPIHLGLYQKVWIISFMRVYVCLLASMLYLNVCLSRSRLCHASYPLRVCFYQSLRPFACAFASIPPRACLDVTTCEIQLCGVLVLDSHLSSFRAMFICLPCLLGATLWLSFLLLHL